MTRLLVNRKLTGDGQSLAGGGGVCLGALGEGGGLGASTVSIYVQWEDDLPYQKVV